MIIINHFRRIIINLKRHWRCRLYVPRYYLNGFSSNILLVYRLIDILKYRPGPAKLVGQVPLKFLQKQKREQKQKWTIYHLFAPPIFWNFRRPCRLKRRRNFLSRKTLQRRTLPFSWKRLSLLKALQWTGDQDSSKGYYFFIQDSRPLHFSSTVRSYKYHMNVYMNIYICRENKIS